MSSKKQRRINRTSRTEHCFVPDCQNRPGIPVEHLAGAANYILDKQPDTVILAGDWWDLPSLSSYEKPGSAYFEGKYLSADLEHGNDQMEDFLKIIRRGDKIGYKPRIVFLMGNHEYRMQRAMDKDPVTTRGILGEHLFHLPADLEVHPFLEIVTIDGIMYSHYFVNPESAMKNVLGGQISNRLNKLKRSFTQGHQQILLTGEQYIGGGQRIRGCVAGAFYQHHEEYMGPQGNDHWRGMIYKHEVRNGDYDLMELSIKYLVEDWT